MPQNSLKNGIHEPLLFLLAFDNAIKHKNDNKTHINDIHDAAFNNNTMNAICHLRKVFCRKK